MQRRKEDNVTSSSSGTQMDQIVLELNYAFAEYVFFDALRFRVGKVKAPFGLYTETYNVGTTRPFFSLPTSLYASPGLVTQSYLGIGFTGAYYFKNDWALQYDIYSGELNLQRYADFTSPMFPAIVDIKLPDMYGARIICQTAINGLDFGVSSYVGSPKFYYNGVERDYFIEGKHVVYDFHLEYLTDAISFRSEYELIGKTKGKDVKVDGYYVEAAYKFFKFWQLAVLYDQQKYKVYDPTFAEIIKLTPSTVDHSEWAFGLNYWFSPNFVLKFSYHLVEGNLFAKPQNIIQAMMSGGLEEKTNLLSVGTQFSF
jgi:hypothetical protein